MLLRDGFGAVASLAAALVPFLDGLFLFFLAMFGCSSATALPHSTSAHVCGSRGAPRPATLPSAFWHQPWTRFDSSRLVFFLVSPGDGSNRAGPVLGAIGEGRFSSVYRGSAQRNFERHEARHRNRPSKHWFANASGLFRPCRFQPLVISRSTCEEVLQ